MWSTNDDHDDDDDPGDDDDDEAHPMALAQPSQGFPHSYPASLANKKLSDWMNI